MSFDATRDMALDLIVMTLKANAPKDTGNLSMNAIRIVEDTVVIGGEIAPYAKKTEEENYSSKGWIKNTMELLYPHLQAFFENNLSGEDIQSMIDDQELNIEQQFDYLASLREDEEQGGG